MLCHQLYQPAHTGCQHRRHRHTRQSRRRGHFLETVLAQPFQPGGLYWSFDYGPIHFVMLDAYTSYGAGSPQYNWLKADLAASTKTWKIIAIHEPGWSAGGGGMPTHDLSK